MLPPSTHPDGINYTWVRYPKSEIPTVDFSIFDSFFENYRKPLSINNSTTTETEAYRSTQNTETEAIKVIVNCDDERIVKLIQENLPEKNGQRNQKIMRLCQALKSIEELRDLEAKSLLPILKKWHELALPIIATKSFSETKADFYIAWGKVKHSSDPVSLAIARAGKALNDGNIGGLDVYGDSPKVLLLALVLRELQTLNGKNPIFLSVRKGEKLFDVNYGTIAAWMRMFVIDGVLEITQKNTSEAATRYRFVGAD